MNRREADIDRRSRQLRDGRRGDGPVLCWLSRDLRISDNWTLLWAQQEAITREKPLGVIFCRSLVPYARGSRQETFLSHGLERFGRELASRHINFTLVEGPEEVSLSQYLRQLDAHVVVSDFDPLRPKRQRLKALLEEFAFPVVEVDSHNIIPAWLVSDKKEYAAYTIRPKIQRLLADYLTDIPQLVDHPFTWPLSGLLLAAEGIQKARWKREGSADGLHFSPGEQSGRLAAEIFIKTGLSTYSELRNDPTQKGQSGLSPYLHFGQLSAQRLAWMVAETQSIELVKGGFLEELIVRRELSDNFCYYEPHYDSFEGFPDWARKTLNQHRDDPREFLYSLGQLEAGETHDTLWNACQIDLVYSGKLHGYLRMYWAKKILEWTPGPEEALEYAVTLNDRYSLDGSDPNGYTGISWSIGGVHDRAWGERFIFGKVRYMSEAGCRRKFDVDRYISSVSRRVQGRLGHS